MTNQLVTVHQDGRLTTTSLIVADHFNKRHTNILQAISKLECSEEFGRLNFQPSTYKTQQNKELPCYCITRDGFMFLVMGFTGKEAAIWKERFINAFNEMEQLLKQQEMTRRILDVLRNKDLRMHIGFDGQLTFKVEEKQDHYKMIADAIRDPANIGLKEDTIRMVLDACVDALQKRAEEREEWGKQLQKKLTAQPQKKEIRRLL